MLRIIRDENIVVFMMMDAAVKKGAQEDESDKEPGKVKEKEANW